MTPQLRRWRIALADDFGPHKTDNVFRLCWQRGYVMMAHGGGQTLVTQTPDTDLNRHVRREYTGVPLHAATPSQGSAVAAEASRRSIGVGEHLSGQPFLWRGIWDMP